ncbi:MAG: thioredoxin family protein [Bacteroidota bacterium]
MERNPGISSQVGVRGVPTLVIYHRGELKWRSSGLQGARELVNALRKFLS